MENKWVEIDDDAILHNLTQVRSLLSAGTRLIAVVKANAYGHGMVETARWLEYNGVDHFAVTFLSEALQLREAGVKGSILLLSPIIEPRAMQTAIQYQLTVMVASRSGALLADQVSRNHSAILSVHLKIETGLNRFGMSADEACEVCRSFKGNSHIYIEGIYTHLADAGAANPSNTLQQFNNFMQTVQKLQEAGYLIPIRHCANSAVTLRFAEMHLDAVRIGTLLSGQFPVGKIPKTIILHDPFQLKARIISVREYPAGSRVGYYGTYRLKKKARVAILPVGFTDGVALEVANPPMNWLDAAKVLIKLLLAWLGVSRFVTRVLIAGYSGKVIGKVFMQFTLVELPDSVEADVGTEAILPARKTLVPVAIRRVHNRDQGKCLERTGG